MKCDRVNATISVLAIATLFNFFDAVKPVAAANIQLIGLTDNNTLISFDSNKPNNASRVGVTGIAGNLVVVDFRPKDGMLYGLTDTNNIYTINPDTGVADLKSTLNMDIKAGMGIGGDFNPTPDRLRLAGGNNQNFRINVDTGEVTVDTTPLAYAMGDTNEGKTPNITAAAYTNAFSPSPDPTRRTTLYEIDSDSDVLVTQGTKDFLMGDPPPAVSPNNGTLFTVGSLGVDFGSTVGFDIFSLSDGKNLAFAASGSTLYSINLDRGNATVLGDLDGSNVNIVGLAARSVPEPSAASTLIGLGIFAVVGWVRDRNKLSS